jgi:asparagine synthase (glutamine-hydrolysing)
MKLAVLFSGGKDSCYALYETSKNNEICCLISIKSKNKDSYMFHTPNIELTKLQSEALKIPLLDCMTEGNKEEELEDLKKAVERAKKKYKIDAVVTGAVASVYQKSRIQKICDELKIKCINPLWQRNQTELLTEMIDNNFKFIITKIAAEGLDSSWLGKIIEKKDIEKIIMLNKKFGLNPVFEGGEAETLVIDAPNFKKKLKIGKAETIMENENTGAYVIKNVELESKSMN